MQSYRRVGPFGDLLGFFCLCGGRSGFLRGRRFGSGDQLNGHQFGGVADPPTSLHHPRITSGTILETASDIAEQLRDDVFAPQEAERPTPGRQGAVFAQRDHAVGEAANFFRLRLGSFNPLMLEQRGHQASEQRPPMFGLSTELSALFSMTHDALSYSFLGAPPEAIASSLTPRLS